MTYDITKDYLIGNDTYDPSRHERLAESGLLKEDPLKELRDVINKTEKPTPRS